MKVVLALALSIPTLAGAMGMATCEPNEIGWSSTTAGGPGTGLYCADGFNQKVGEPDDFSTPEECYWKCVDKYGCDGFVVSDFNYKSGCFCQDKCTCLAEWDDNDIFLASTGMAAPGGCP